MSPLSSRVALGNIVGGAARTSRHPLIAAFFLLMLAMAGIGYLSYRGVADVIESRETEKVHTVARLKEHQIEGWLKLKQTLAVERINRPLFVEAVERWFKDLSTPDEQRATKHLNALRTSREHEFAGISLFDAAGRTRYISGEALGNNQDVQRLIQAMNSRNDVLLIDLHRSAPDGRIRLALFSRIRSSGSGALGYVAFIMDPARELFPLIANNNDAIGHTEAQLFRRDGNDALLLSPATGGTQQPLQTRIRLDQADSAAVAGLTRGEGIVSALDFGGKPVLASIRAIDGTSWILVAQVDRVAALSGLGEVALIAVTLALMIIITGGSLTHSIWRQQRLKASLDSARELETIASSVPGALVSFAQTGPDSFSLVYASQAFETLTGLTPGLLIARPQAFLERVHPEDLQTFRAWRNRNRGTQANSVQAQWRFDHPERGEVWLEGQASALEHSDGRRIWQGFFEDITQRKSLESEQAESAQHFRNLADNGNVLIWTSETNKLCNYFNKPWLDFTGRTIDQERGNGWAEGVHPDDVERCLEIYSSRFDRREPFRMEYRLRHASGEYRWIDDQGTPRYDTHGNFLGYIGHCIDITERIRAEEEIRKLSMAIEQSPESIVITDLEARIQYVNDAFVRKTGYSRDEAMGQNPRILHSGKTTPGTYESMWQALQAGEVWQGEFVNQKKDSTPYIELATISPIRQPDGHISHYLAIKEDITERKRLEEELERHRFHLEELVLTRTEQLSHALEQAEAANRAKSVFLANMSHEIRTPMNAILGLSHLLRRNSQNPEQMEKLAKIESSAEHLISILSDILDLSKIEAGRMELEHTDFALDAILDHVRSLIGEQAAAKQLPVFTEIVGLPTWLRGDPTRLRQALLNYASNAVKFTERGSITLRARLLSENENRLVIRFEVADTGIGLSEEARERVFSAFEQADTSTTRKFGGTGLGLTITRRLAQLMDGESGVDSTPGVGSTFWFTARLSPGTAAMPRQPVHADAELQLSRSYGHVRLLLAEDNEINRLVALELLNGVNLQVDTAVDGMRAVEMAASRRYDLILMDLQMPTLSGIDAARRIRGMAGYDNVPIIAMTANAFEESRYACIEAGMNDFVTKPVNPEILFQTLLAWLPNESTRTQRPASSPLPAHRPPDWSAFGQIAGIDLAHVQKIFPGKPEKYAQLLRLFADNHQDDDKLMARLIETADMESARRIAHGLKGTAGNLGLEAIYALAAELNGTLGGNDAAAEVPERLLRLSQALGQTLGDIRRMLACEPSEQTGSNTEPFAPLLPQLESLLQAGDMAASDLARQHSKQLVAELGEAAHPLLQAIATYDYAGALENLHRIKQAGYH